MLLHMQTDLKSASFWLMMPAFPSFPSWDRRAGEKYTWPTTTLSSFFINSEFYKRWWCWWFLQCPCTQKGWMSGGKTSLLCSFLLSILLPFFYLILTFTVSIFRLPYLAVHQKHPWVSRQWRINAVASVIYERLQFDLFVPPGSSSSLSRARDHSFS